MRGSDLRRRARCLQGRFWSRPRASYSLRAIGKRGPCVACMGNIIVTWTTCNTSEHRTSLCRVVDSDSSYAGACASDMNCDYCNNEVELVGGDAIYPHRPDLHALKFYYCAPSYRSVQREVASAGSGGL